MFYSLTEVKGNILCYLTMLALAEHLPVALWHNEHANITLGICSHSTTLRMAAGGGRAARAAAEERSPIPEPWPAEIIV